MRYVANYEINSDVSVILDGEELQIQHPKGLFKARIKNIVRKDYSTPFLLSMQLAFDAPGLQEAKEIGQERLIDCLNLLAFITGSSFTRHRTRLVVDATSTTGMRDCLMWSDEVTHEDPQPILEPRLMRSVERLLQFDAPSAIRRALRWYRFGINSTQPEDQFQYFWFALEIIAEHQKSSEKVPDRCPDCHNPLYCETCKKHPTHRMYAKQAIRALIEAADKDCKVDTIEMLDETRNRLMHGAIIREIEDKLPKPSEDIVDVLGKIVFKALVHQFPREIFREYFHVAVPTTYVHRTMTGVAHVQTVAQKDATGEISMGGITGLTFQVVTDGPPQSALRSVIEMTHEQFEQLRKLSHEKGDQQEMCKRVYQRAHHLEDKVLSLVLATDMARIEEAIKRAETGAWQDLFREIVTANKPKLYKPRH